MHPEQEGAFRLDYILGLKPPVLTSLQHLGHLTGACERDTGALCVCEDAAGQKDANFVAWAAGTGGGNGRRQCYFYKIKLIYLDHCLKKSIAYGHCLRFIVRVRPLFPWRRPNSGRGRYTRHLSSKPRLPSSLQTSVDTQRLGGSENPRASVHDGEIDTFFGEFLLRLSCPPEVFVKHRVD